MPCIITTEPSTKKLLCSSWFYANSKRRLPLAGLEPSLRNSKWAEAFKPEAVSIVNSKITVKHDLTTGTVVTFSSTGELPEPLFEETEYYAIRISATCIKLAGTEEDATAGEAMEFITTGTGVHTLQLEIPSGFGSGTEEDPYRIRNYTDLCRTLTEEDTLTAWWELCADIDAAASESMEDEFGNSGWPGIGAQIYSYDDQDPPGVTIIGDPFTGHFDGNNHTISNLHVYKWHYDDEYGMNHYYPCAGFFGGIQNANISNLGIINIDFEVYFLAGGLCAMIHEGTSVITNCYTTGTINEIWVEEYSVQRPQGLSIVGGFVGYLYGDYASITNTNKVNHCYSNCTFVNTRGSEKEYLGTGERKIGVGGFIGVNRNGEITNCYAAGAVAGSICIGGFVGTNVYWGHILNCYSTATLTDNTYDHAIYNHTSAQLGGFCGQNLLMGKICNCYATGSVSGDNLLGGFVGLNGDTVIEWGATGAITNCYATGNVSGLNRVGGFAGTNYLSGDYWTIRNCYATGNASGGSYIGGFIGINELNSLIKRCYATGSATGTLYYVGGFAGYNHIDSSMKNCWSSGASSGAEYVGGFCGIAEYTAKFLNCYSTGFVTCPGTYIGGFCGYATSSSTVESCYYDSTTSGQSVDDIRGTPKTTAQMKQQATFVDWDFDFTWRIIEDETYPWIYGSATAPAAFETDGFRVLTNPPE